jgi:RND family efflux transporter MFP subunit
MSSDQSSSFWKTARTPLLALAIVAAIAVLAVAGWSFLGDFGATQNAYVYYTVTSGDLPIVVTERGSLEAQKETTIRNRVESISERSGNSGTQIIFIVPNGSEVKGPPPPEYTVKLDGDLLKVFSISGEDNPESEVERFQAQRMIEQDAVSQTELPGIDLVEELNAKRMLPALRDQFIAIDPEFPERVEVTAVKPGEQWSVSRTGDLLIELDSATIRDKMEQQEVTVQKAISARIQAQSKYDNQELQNETLLAEAVLKVKLAELELKKFRDPVKGDHQLKVEEIQRNIDDQNNKILQSRADLELKANNQRGIEALFKLGYKGKGDLDNARLDFLSGESGLVASMNRLETFQASLDSLKEYDREMQELTLQGSVETAERARKQVDNDNVALLQQALAAKDESIKTAEKEQDRLTRLETQLEYCKIFAPHEGMVVYAREGRGEVSVAEGATVRERQRLVTLPDLKLMQVKTQIHEAVLDQVHAGLPVTVRIEGFSENVYRATVHSVAVVPQPSSWGGSGVKTYATMVRIDDEVNNLKPGMTAVCEIHVDRLKDVLTIPVQAVIQIERDNWCYIEAGNGVERRMLELGRSNDKFVHIQKGLSAGERVVLNPTSILEEMEQAGNEISPEKGEPEVLEGMTKPGEASEPSEKTTPAPKKGEVKKGDPKKAEGQKKKRGMSERFKNMDPEQRKKMFEAYRKKREAGGGK